MKVNSFQGREVTGRGVARWHGRFLLHGVAGGRSIAARSGGSMPGRRRARRVPGLSGGPLVLRRTVSPYLGGGLPRMRAGRIWVSPEKEVGKAP